jgi:hypothetical protein
MRAMRKTFHPFPFRELPPDVSVSFGKSENDKHWFWIEVECNVRCEPVALFNELHDAGFKRTIEASPLPDGIVIRKFVKRGSKIHGLCTESEVKKNMDVARTVLKQFNFHDVPVNAYSQSDLV